MTVVLFLGQIDEYEMLEAAVRIMTVGFSDSNDVQ